ncbi:hypothetical protein Syun_022434 [Stephania yunnanensis]|uniref:Uncharacterized protein n=1 Tax=Stephania yunnanensis TaxID=152371 RepID=A0AAP0HYJ0_9MAGN
MIVRNSSSCMLYMYKSVIRYDADVFHCDVARWASASSSLSENLSSLEGGIAQLRNIKEEVGGMVQMAEAQQMPCRPVVRGWLVRVQGTDDHVTSVVVQSNKELQDRWSSCCPKLNCCRSYKLGKEVVE